MSNKIIKKVIDLAKQLKHDKARYVGDGDPGRNNYCIRCQADDLIDEIGKFFDEKDTDG